MWIYAGIESLKAAGETIHAAIQEVLKVDAALHGPWEKSDMAMVPSALTGAACVNLFISRKTDVQPPL